MTCVGARASGSRGDDEAFQFEISDKRSVKEVKKMLSLKGYQPVLKDWIL